MPLAPPPLACPNGDAAEDNHRYRGFPQKHRGGRGGKGSEAGEIDLERSCLFCETSASLIVWAG